MRHGRRGTLAVLAAAASVLVGCSGSEGLAGAAASVPGQFCAALRTALRAGTGTSPVTAGGLYQQVAAAWDRADQVAPPAVKADVDRLARDYHELVTALTTGHPSPPDLATDGAAAIGRLTAYLAGTCKIVP